MTRTIVPHEVAGGQREGDAVIEDALHIVDVGFGFINGIGGEEAGRWHLFRVAHADEGFSSSNGSNGFACGHLGCLVEANDVEGWLVEVDELRH